MINSSHKTLKNLASLAWIIGGIVLFAKSYSLLKQANVLSDNFFLIIGVLIFAFIVGLIKNKYIMSKFCKKNLDRIFNLTEPKLYQFFELKFFFYLALMILAGATLSKLAIGNHYALLAIGGLDLSLSTALLTSSPLYFKKS